MLVYQRVLRTPWTLGGAFPRPRGPRAARALGTFCRRGFGGHAAGLEVWTQGAAAQTAWANEELKPQNDELSIAYWYINIDIYTYIYTYI